MGLKEQNIVIDWGDVKNGFIDTVRHGKKFPGPNANNDFGRRMLELHRDPYTKMNWEGGAAADTLDNLDNGYRAEEFLHSADYVPTGMKKRASWSEEDGDVDPGRLYGGYDEFFLTQEERESKPGLRLQFEFSFSCGLKAKVIEQYGAWCAGLIASLEQSGYDLTVDMWIHLDNLFSGQRGVRTNVLVRVKRENEVSDFTEWSALFGPTGYRHLGFCAKLVAGNKINKMASHTLGTTLVSDWGLEYDRERQTVKVRVNQRGYGTFPRQRLNQEARAAGLLPKLAEGEVEQEDPDPGEDQGHDWLFG